MQVLKKACIVKDLQLHDIVVVKACIVKEHAGLHSERACRHDKIIVNKSGIVEELATLHDNKKIVVVKKSLHSERACRSA